MGHIGIVRDWLTPSAEGTDMTTTIGGTAVRSGYYWNLGKWEVIPVERDGGQLPGGRGDKFLRIPVVVVLALLPMLGGLFVVFLPVIGFALVAYALAKKVAALVGDGAADLASTLTPGWRPGEAHLTGTPGEADKDLPHEHGAGDQALEALKKEIADKREHQDN
jgi:hypothetical protein